MQSRVKPATRHSYTVHKYIQGKSCEIDMNMCRSDPCLNGGTCRNMPNTFECTCAPGFNGSLCDEKNVEQGLFNMTTVITQYLLLFNYCIICMVLYPSIGDPSSSGIVVYVGSGFAAFMFIIVVIAIVVVVTVVCVGKKKTEVNGT